MDELENHNNIESSSDTSESELELWYSPSTSETDSPPSDSYVQPHSHKPRLERKMTKLKLSDCVAIESDRESSPEIFNIDLLINPRQSTSQHHDKPKKNQSRFSTQDSEPLIKPRRRPGARILRDEDIQNGQIQKPNRQPHIFDRRRSNVKPLFNKHSQRTKTQSDKLLKFPTDSSDYKNKPDRPVCIDKCSTGALVKEHTFQVLTHLHTDHHLARIAGYAYCSEETKRLAKKFNFYEQLRGVGLNTKLVFPYDWDKNHKYKPITFWLFPSWHCAGSVMVLYTQGLVHEKSDYKKTFYLNTGDFRYDKWDQYESPSDTTKTISKILTSNASDLIVYYDDTFTNHKNMPSRKDSVNKIALEIAKFNGQPVNLVTDWLNTGLPKALHKVKNVTFVSRNGKLTNTLGDELHPSALSKRPDDPLFYSDHGSESELIQFVQDLKPNKDFKVEMIKLSDHNKAEKKIVSTTEVEVLHNS